MTIKLSDNIIKTCAQYGIEIALCDQDQFTKINCVELNTNGIKIYSIGQWNCITGSCGDKNKSGKYIIYVKDNFNTDNLNLDNEIYKILSKFISKYNHTKQENKLISQNVIDYCNKWGIKVINVATDLYNLFKLQHNTGSSPFSNYFCMDWKNKIIYAKCHTDADLINGMKIPPAEFEYTNKNNILMHELTHILMRIRPEYINEFLSPFIQTWVLNLKACGIFLSEEKKKSILTSTPYNRNKKLYDENSFDKFIDDRIPELVEAGIFNSDGTPTFNFKDIKPNLSWVNLNSLM